MVEDQWLVYFAYREVFLDLPVRISTKFRLETLSVIVTLMLDDGVRLSNEQEAWARRMKAIMNQSRELVPFEVYLSPAKLEERANRFRELWEREYLHWFPGQRWPERYWA